MPRLKRPQDIRYLAFEGGGGRGITYLGAIKALEELNVLPIQFLKVSRSPNYEFVVERDKLVREKNQIQGISGSSAGALVALLLALGNDYASIKKLLERKADLEQLYDQIPEPGYLRSVINYTPAKYLNPNLFAKSRDEAIRVINGRYSKIPYALLLAKLVIDYYRRSLSFVETIARPKLTISYLYNLLYDRGIFPGFMLSQYLTFRIMDFLSHLPEQVTPRGFQSLFRVAARLTFAELYDWTGMELVVTGYFSRKHTPHFPLVDAVAISMNFPMIFKPVWVELSDKPEYNGYWVDGGLLNNRPIHAFDTQPYQPIDRSMLALRLAEPQDERRPPRLKEVYPEGWHNLEEFNGHLADLIGTFLFWMEEGQLRTPLEKEQTIDLNTYDLSTIEFAPSKERSKKAVENAYRAVVDYFRS